jgi:hypothetical protein
MNHSSNTGMSLWGGGEEIVSASRIVFGFFHQKRTKKMKGSLRLILLVAEVYEMFSSLTNYKLLYAD